MTCWAISMSFSSRRPAGDGGELCYQQHGPRVPALGLEPVRTQAVHGCRRLQKCVQHYPLQVMAL